MAHGTIYLVQPVFGCSRLTGEAVIGPTWVEYTFAPGAGHWDSESRERQDPMSPGCAAEAADNLDRNPNGLDAPHNEHRVLIPLTNVTAISLGDDPDDIA